MSAFATEEDTASPLGLALLHNVGPAHVGLIREACRLVPADVIDADRIEDCAVLVQSRKAVCVVTSARPALNARLADAADTAFRRSTLVVAIDADSGDDAALWRKLAWGVLENPVSAEDACPVLRAAIEEAALRGNEWDLVEDFHQRRSTLTSDEDEVLEAVVAGKLNKQIANDLRVSMRTVEQRRRRMFSKMKVPSAIPLAEQLATVRTLEGRHGRRASAPHFCADPRSADSKNGQKAEP